MKIPFVDLYAQYLSIKTEIDDAIQNVIAESSFIRGHFVDEFENAFASVIGVKHCVSCANGTDALYIAMKSLGLKPGDEVITTAHSWISTSETISQLGGKVIFCDTDKNTFTIDPALIEKKITSRTVGIIPVHLYGQPADMDPILAIAKKHSIWIIEDCAQAHMAEYKGRKVGTMGTLSTFSFYPGKNLGAMGDAGAIVTNDVKLSTWCSLYARHGGKGEHTMEGINSRMDGMQAAILSVKLPKLKGWIDARNKVAGWYNKYLAEIPQVKVPVIAKHRTHVYHLYVILTEDRDGLRKHLSDKGIETMLNYSKALPFYPAYTHLFHTHEDFPVAYANQNKILSLPIYPELSEINVQFIADQIKIFYSGNREK